MRLCQRASAGQGAARLLLALVMLATPSWAWAAEADAAWGARHAFSLERVEAGGEALEGPVRAMAEDAEGLVWLVAGAELWRWDGRRLVDATVEGASAAQGPAVMQTVAADARGRIWAGSTMGLLRVESRRPGDLRLATYPINGERPSITRLAFDREDSVWLGAAGTVSEVILLPREGAATRVVIPDAGLNRLHALHVDSRGRLWAGTTFGLFELRRPSATQTAPQWREQPLDAERPRVAAIDSDAQGRLWVGLAQGGVHCIDPDGRVSHLPWATDDDALARVFALSAAAPGELWVGTFGSGLRRWREADGRWIALRHDRGRPASLDDDNVWSLMRDRRGLLWVGQATGAQLFDPGEPRMWHVPLPIDPQQPGERLRVHAVAASNAAGTALWLGMGNGRVRRFGDGVPANEDARLDVRWGRGDGTGGAVELIRPLPDGRWWLGSDWLTALAPSDGGALRPLQPASRGASTYSSDVVAWQGHWWLSGPDGLWRMPLDAAGQPRVDDARNLYAERKGERRVSALLPRPGVLWVGTWGGVERLSEAAVAPEPVPVPELDGHFVTVMAVDRRDQLWVGTSEGGLFVVEESKALDASAWTRIDGLPARGVAAVLVDADGHVWVSTARGLVAIDPATRALRVFRPGDGAAAAPYLRRAAALLADGSVVMGGNDALTVIRPGALSRMPPPRETALVLTNLATGEGDDAPSPLAPDVPRRDDWRVGPGTARLDIEFVAPQYLGASRLRYRHRLVGVDADWTLSPTADGRASYSRLPPGRYRFEAQVQGRDGDWGGTLAFDVVRAPAWHEETLFRVAFGLLAAGLVLLGLRARLLMLRQRATTLEQMVQARTAALAQANAELADAHRAVEEASLTDPLTGLHNRRFLWRHIESDVALALRSRFGGEAAMREPADLIFFLVDVDHFKRINDQHGHAVGDLVLIEMGRRLRAVFRESDHVVRWGGEEFLGVARDTDRDDAARVAERIRSAIAEAPFALPGGQMLSVRCSIGYAALPLVAAHRHAFGWEDTVAIADEALYQAKAAGRDGWAGFEESGEPIDPQDLAALRLRSTQAADVRGLLLRRR